MAVPYDVVVIGGGSGGLVVASAASQLKAKVLLVEKSPRIGGDCLWYGCVPSKSLIHMAHQVHTIREAAHMGLASGSGLERPEIDYLKVYHHIRGAQNFIADHADNPDRFRGYGVELVYGSGRFINPHTFEVNGRQLRARAFVIATGSRALIPNLPGLEEVGYLTNESMFDLQHLPTSVAVVGGGPIGCELGQALARLGSQVTIVAGSKPQILPKEDPEAAQIVQHQLQSEGIQILTQERVIKVWADSGSKWLQLQSGKVLNVQEILIASGRIPNVEDLGLDQASVACSASGIDVNEKLQTTNPKIYGCGDVIGGYQFTHVAAHEAVTVLTNALFFPIKSVDYRVIPWATFTDPELARVGMTETEARTRYGDTVVVLKTEMQHVDRAQAEGATQGFCKIICDPKGQILGAHIVGKSAGELISEIVLAMNYKLPVSALTGIHVYPTLSEVSAKTALQLKKQTYAKNQFQQSFLRWFFGRRRQWAR